MTNDRANDGHGSIAKDLAVVGAFLVGGALSGLLLAWLITLPRLQQFFFVKGDKFLIPRYSYWFAFSLIQLFGLALAYSICCCRKWLTARREPGRLVLIALIVGLVTPALRSLTPLMNSHIGLYWDFVVAPLLFLVLLSVALCLLTRSLRLLAWAFVLNVLFVATGFVFVYAVLKMSAGANEWYDFVQWPILEAMMGLSFGTWIIWRGARQPS